jgi:uncharacterized membrane protein YkoI
MMRLLLILLGTTWASIGALAQTGACFSDWSQASVIVKAEGLVTIEQLTKAGAARLGGEIVRSTLCEGKSGYVYKLVVRDAQGQLKNVILDAKTPF